ncbi:MAG: AMP-binding protein, partial [Holophagales bacterium]|nr:AMP-binding protein [Holophagales bacterium]
KLFFGYATGSNLFFPFAVGGAAVLFREHPTPEVLFDKIERHRPTILINVPTVIRRMLEHPGAAGRDLSSLRFATSAGEALPADLHRRWRETFGVDLLDGLGTAEMWHIFVSNRPGEVRPGTLGRAVDGFEVEVRDPEGRPLPDGQVGRLWVRGGSRALAYWQHQEKSHDAFRGEWFAAGDLVERDAEGYITYCGRDDDTLKVAGRWLIPREVEDCLARHAAVAECAVVGVSDEAGLTKPHAFVRLAEGFEEGGATDLAEQLKAWCLDHLEAYKHPRRVHLLSSFPRTHLGKVDRGALERMAEQAGESEQADRATP